jgi:hypothetical protein
MAEPAQENNPVQDPEVYSDDDGEVDDGPEQLSQVGFAEEPYEDEDLEDRLFPSKIGGRPVRKGATFPFNSTFSSPQSVFRTILLKISDHTVSVGPGRGSRENFGTFSVNVETQPLLRIELNMANL